MTALTTGATYVRATSGAASDSVRIVVNAPPVITVTPAALSFAARVGASAPSAQSVLITNRGGGRLNGLSSSVAYGGGATGWLALAFDSTGAPATLTVTPVPAAISAGSYSATITIASSIAGVASQTVAVTLIVSPATALPKLDLGPDLRHPAGLQARRTLTLATGPSGPLKVTFRSLDPTRLLISARGTDVGVARDSVEVAGGTTTNVYWMHGVEGGSGFSIDGRPATLVAEAPGYAPDTMVVTLTRPGVELIRLGPQDVPAIGGPDPIFRLTVGEIVSPTLFVPMPIRVGGAIQNFSVGTSAAQNARPQFFASVLTVGASQGPATQVIFALAPGSSATSWGQVPEVPELSLRVARTPGGSGFVFMDGTAPAEYDWFGAGTVLYRLTGTAPPSIGVAPGALSFSATASAASPAPQLVAITNSGLGTLDGLSAGVLYGAGASDWLAVAFNTTAAPATLTVTPSTATLPIGTYTATITVASSIAGVASRDIAVTLDVSSAAPPPRLALGADRFHPIGLQAERVGTLPSSAANEPSSTRHM